MKAQLTTDRSATLAMQWGEPLRIERAAGELRVRSGRVWLTRRGDLDDHVLAAGDCVVLLPGQSAVVEAWRPGEAAVLEWRPRAQLGRLAAFGLRALGAFARALPTVGLLRPARAALEALARKAASSASCAHGCI